MAFAAVWVWGHDSELFILDSFMLIINFMYKKFYTWELNVYNVVFYVRCSWWENWIFRGSGEGWILYFGIFRGNFRFSGIWSFLTELSIISWAFNEFLGFSLIPELSVKFWRHDTNLHQNTSKYPKILASFKSQNPVPTGHKLRKKNFHYFWWILMNFFKNLVLNFNIFSIISLSTDLLTKIFDGLARKTRSPIHNLKFKKFNGPTNFFGFTFHLIRKFWREFLELVPGFSESEIIFKIMHNVLPSSLT